MKPQRDILLGYRDEGGVFARMYSLKEMEFQIRKAYIHGQGNGAAMEAGLERDELEDYVRSVITSL